MESKSDFRQYYGPRASLLYLCPSPAIMWSAAAVLSGVWSHWPARKHYRFQSRLLDAFMPLWNDSHHIITLILPAAAIHTVVLQKSPHELNVVCWCSDRCKGQCKVSGLFPPHDLAVLLTVWTLAHFSWEPTSPRHCSYSLKRIRWGVHRRGIGQSAYNSPPRLRINQHWCKTIKPMRYNYLFILITQSGAVWSALSKCITRRWLRTQTAPAISVSLCVCCVWVQRRSGSPLKQPLERYPIRLGPFPLPSILFWNLTSSGHHRRNESCWWRMWGNGMDGWMTGPTTTTEPPRRKTYTSPYLALYIIPRNTWGHMWRSSKLLHIWDEFLKIM